MYFIQRLLFNASQKSSGRAVLTWLEYEKKGQSRKDGDVCDSVRFLEEKRSFSVRELAAVIERVAGYYKKTLGLQPGDNVMLCFPPGYEFYVCFMACLYIGAVAVPVYPPQSANYSFGMEKLHLVSQKCRPVCILTTSDFKRFMFVMEAKQFFGGKRVKLNAVWKVVSSNLFKVDLEAQIGSLVTPFVPKGHETAFLQFTSGSTGDPKGVIVTYDILNANLALMKKDCNPQSSLAEGSVIVSWMPQYHDFGLIATALFPCAYNLHAVLMSPVTFLRHPLAWLLAVTKYKAKGTASPNFGYTRCCKAWNVLAESQRPLIDLSSVDFFLNAAEPIRVSTLERWEETFSQYGLKPSSMVPCYGMAESVVYIGGCWGDNRESRILIDDATGMVACMDLNHCNEVKVTIVNPSSLSHVPDGSVGEIWLASSSVAAGYYGQTDLSNETFKAIKDGAFWLRTGDLGFVKSGYLYIAGRLKDLIIVNGRNIYPQDVELLLEERCGNLRPGCLAVFQMNTGFSVDVRTLSFAENSVGVVAELRNNKDDLTPTIRSIVAALSSEGLSLEILRFVETRTIPKTSSGKIRRSTCREYVLEGRLSVVSGGCIDKRELREIQNQLPSEVSSEVLTMAGENGSPADEAAGEVQERIKDIWKGILDLDGDLSEQDDFFALGGSSLQAFELIGMLQLEFDFPLLNPSVVHLNPTLGSLTSAILDLSQQTGIRPPEATLWQTLRRPASENQKQMWVLKRSGIDMSAYNIHVVLDLKGPPVDISSLTRALHAVVMAQESLRYVFYCPHALLRI
jgi:acyl-CoA synthetase (AMP-forming)/AMP-acid ligase II